MQRKKFTVKARIKSFGHAFNGLKSLITGEHNFRIHLATVAVVLVLASILHLSAYEWVALVLVMGLVISLEVINTAVEKMADIVSPEKSNTIKTIKDVLAAGVLIGAITAVIIGCLIFLPKIFCACSGL